MQMNVFWYLTVLAEEGSFYAAAKRLPITQQGLNKSILGLESELGVQLVERRPGGVSITREGETVLRYAKQFSALYDQMADDLFAVQAFNLKRGERVMVHVSYYSAQIASADPEYVGMLSQNLLYIEEPYDKLVRRAEMSDGSDLVFLDVHAHSLPEVLDNPRVRFIPVLSTQVGMVWKEGSALAGVDPLIPAAVAQSPVALNTNREVMQLVERLFDGNMPKDIRMGSTSPRMLLEYTHMSQGIPCIYDSFGFYLSQHYGSGRHDDLRFTPFATDEAQILVGFLVPRDAELAPEAAYVIKVLNRFLNGRCGDYRQQHPVPDLE